MQKLLPDNMDLAEQLEALLACLGQQAKLVEQREIESLIMWVSSFITYVAIIAEAHPEQAQDMLGYYKRTQQMHSTQLQERTGVQQRKLK